MGVHNNIYIDYYANTKRLHANLCGLVLILLCISAKLLLDTILSIDVIFVNLLLYITLLTQLNIRRISLVFIVIPVLALVATINSHAFSSLYALFVVYVLKRYKIQTIAQFNVIISSLFLCVMYFLIELGYVEIDSVSYLNLDRIRYRRDFGFGNSNQFAIFIFSFLVNLWIAMRNKMRLLYFTVLVCMTVVISNYTDSRTYLLSSVCLIIFLVIRALRWDRCIAYKLFAVLLPLGALVFSLYIPYHDDYGIFNALSSGRISYYKQLLDSASIFHYIVGTGTVHEITIDSTYLHLIFDAGVIVCVSFYALYYYVLFYKYQHLYYYMPIVLSILVYGTFESYFINVANPGNIIIWLILLKCAFVRSCQVKVNIQ